MIARRTRVARLESQRTEEGGGVIGIFEADVDAGLWREVNGSRTLPLSPEDLLEGHQAGGTGLLLLAPAGTSMMPVNLSSEEL